MTKDEFQQYWIPARNLETLKDGLEASQQLATRLGYAYPYAGAWKYIPLTFELKNALIGLAGPHRQTLAKIYQIRREFHEQKRRAYKQKRRARLRQIKQADRDAEGEAGVDPSRTS